MPYFISFFCWLCAANRPQLEDKMQPQFLKPPVLHCGLHVSVGLHHQGADRDWLIHVQLVSDVGLLHQTLQNESTRLVFPPSAVLLGNPLLWEFLFPTENVSHLLDHENEPPFSCFSRSVRRIKLSAGASSLHWTWMILQRLPLTSFVFISFSCLLSAFLFCTLKQEGCSWFFVFVCLDVSNTTNRIGPHDVCTYFESGNDSSTLCGNLTSGLTCSEEKQQEEWRLWRQQCCQSCASDSSKNPHGHHLTRWQGFTVLPFRLPDCLQYLCLETIQMLHQFNFISLLQTEIKINTRFYNR